MRHRIEQQVNASPVLYELEVCMHETKQALLLLLRHGFVGFGQTAVNGLTGQRKEVLTWSKGRMCCSFIIIIIYHY